MENKDEKHVKLVIRKNLYEEFNILIKQFLAEKCIFILDEMVRGSIFHSEFLQFTHNSDQRLFFNISNFYQHLENFLYENLYLIEFKRGSKGRCLFGITIKNITDNVKLERNAYMREYKENIATIKGKKFYPSGPKEKLIIKRNPLPKDVLKWDIHNIYPENFHEWLLDYQKIGNIEYDTMSDARNSLWRSYAFNYKEISYWLYKRVLSWADKYLEHLEHLENKPYK